MAIKNNSIQSFAFAENIVVRSLLDKDNHPWFVAADVCKALEIGNVTMALRRLDKDEYALNTIEGLSRSKELINIIKIRVIPLALAMGI